MANDIFSNYIEKQNNNKAIPSAMSTDENTSIALLKEISQKLESLSANSIQANTVANNGNTKIVDIAIENGKVVLPDNGVFSTNIYIKDGKIISLGNEKDVSAVRRIDASGKYVLPGIIDPHVHLGLFAPIETELDTETKSAVVSGVTTIGCYFGGAESHVLKFDEIRNKVSQYAHADVIPSLVIGNETQKKEIIDCIRKYGVKTFKLYMNGIPGIVPDVDDAFILDVFDEVKKSGNKCMICVHAENRDLVRRANAKLKEEKGNNATIQDWTETHPDMAEEEAVIRLSYLAEKSGVDVYFVHISSKAAIDTLKKIKTKNKYVHVETTSPYLSMTRTLTESNRIKMEPPFRDAEDVEELWQAVEEGTIECIGTDNTTQTLAEKNDSGSIWEAVPGYPALATHLPVVLNEGVIKRGLSIEKVIGKMTKKPAELFGVYPQKGTLMPGSDGDVVIVDLNLEKQVKSENLLSRSDFSIYEGRYLKGWPVMTIKGGKIVAENGSYIETSTKGKCLER